MPDPAVPASIMLSSSSASVTMIAASLLRSAGSVTVQIIAFSAPLADRQMMLVTVSGASHGITSGILILAPPLAEQLVNADTPSGRHPASLLNQVTGLRTRTRRLQQVIELRSRIRLPRLPRLPRLLLLLLLQLLRLLQPSPPPLLSQPLLRAQRRGRGEQHRPIAIRQPRPERRLTAIRATGTGQVNKACSCRIEALFTYRGVSRVRQQIVNGCSSLGVS
jgi:hypothetical protein